jgi:hypothetical protein
MPDIATALRTAMNKWDDEPPTTKVEPEPTPPNPPEPKVYFTTTNNVCRATFDHIRDNPGKTRKEVCNALAERGYKESSTTTLIGQMLKQHHVRESKGALYAVNDQYVPLKGSKAWAKLQAAKAAKAAKAAPRKHVELVSKSTGKVFNPRPAPVPTALPVEKEWEPNDVIAKLNVHQALALFKALRNILVG